MSSDGMDETVVRGLLETSWGLSPDVVAPLGGGMNSRTWDVAASGRRMVVKAVALRGAVGFEAGLHAAVALEAGGLAAGRPLARPDGSLSLRLPQQVVAVLDRVPGRELGEDAGDVTTIGRTLGLAHQVLARATVPGAPSFDWIDLGARHLDLEPWIRPAVRSALSGWAAARSAVHTWSFIHGDPSPEAFVQDGADGSCGLIDWAGGMFGPCLYDLASASMYVGPELTPALVDAYRETGPLDGREIAVGFGPLQRLRFAVQADYFARRVLEHDTTGLDDAGENLKGLRDAQVFLGVG